MSSFKWFVLFQPNKGKQATKGAKQIKEENKQTFNFYSYVIIGVNVRFIPFVNVLIIRYQIYSFLMDCAQYFVCIYFQLTKVLVVLDLNCSLIGVTCFQVKCFHSFNTGIYINAKCALYQCESELTFDS